MVCDHGNRFRSICGSGTELVAPLSVGENATIGAGSTITEDVLRKTDSRKVLVSHNRKLATRDAGDRQD